MTRTILLIVVAFVLGMSIPVVFPDQFPKDCSDILAQHDHDQHGTSMVHSDHDQAEHDSMGHDHSSMKHEPVEVDPTLPIPTVDIELVEDAMAGYNLYLTTQHFTFEPHKASSSGPLPNEGHAHVYINGAKVARLYGEAMHLEDDLFTKGENTVTVTLNSNNHSDRTINNTPIQDSQQITIE